MKTRELIACGILLTAPLAPARAHGVPDQQQTTALPPCFGLQDVFGGSVYQSFVPSQGTFVGIDAMFDIAAPVDVTIELLEGECPGPGALLGSRTESLSAGSGQIVHYDFAPTVAIVSGQPYSVRVTATDAGQVAICGASTNPYPNGNASGAGCAAFPGADGYFVTYADPLPPAPPTSMAGYWPFEEGSGTVTADRSGHSVAGELAGATWVIDPERDDVLAFGGDGDHVHVPDFVAELGQGSFSLAAWVKIEAGSAGALILKGDGGAGWDVGEKQLWFGDGGVCCNSDGERPSFVGHGNDYIIPAADLGTTGWHHVVFTWEYQGGTSGVPRVYFDGVEQPLSLGTYAANNPDRPGDTFYIGVDGSDEASHSFLGLADDVAVFDAVLDPDQILAIMGGDFSQFIDIFADGFESGDTAAWSATVPPP